MTPIIILILVFLLFSWLFEVLISISLSFLLLWISWYLDIGFIVFWLFALISLLLANNYFTNLRLKKKENIFFPFLSTYSLLKQYSQNLACLIFNYLFIVVLTLLFSFGIYIFLLWWGIKDFFTLSKISILFLIIYQFFFWINIFLKFDLFKNIYKKKKIIYFFLYLFLGPISFKLIKQKKFFYSFF